MVDLLVLNFGWAYFIFMTMVIIRCLKYYKNKFDNRTNLVALSTKLTDKK